MDTLFAGLQEQGRLEITNELRRFIEVNNHEAVKVGDLEKNSEAIKAVGADLHRERFSDGAVRAEVHEMTFRKGEEGTPRSFIDIAHVQVGRWRPPLVDEDWHAVCQAIHQGVGGAQWENLYCRFVEMNKEVNVRHPSGSNKAKTPWKRRDAKDRGDTHYDRSFATKIDRREEVRQELRSAHLQSTVFALLRRVEVWTDAGSSTARGSRRRVSSSDAFGTQEGIPNFL